MPQQLRHPAGRVRQPVLTGVDATPVRAMRDGRQDGGRQFIVGGAA